MKIRKQYLTEIIAINPLTPNEGLLTWEGPIIWAYSQDEASEYCKTHLGYCKVIGESVGMVTEDGYIETPANPTDDNDVSTQRNLN